MRHLVYAGIGSRATPRAVLETMTVMAAWLARKGWRLHAGGAAGADTAFAAGAPPSLRTLFLPWSGYRGNAGPDCRTLSARTAAPLSLDRLGPASRLAPLLARGTEACTLETAPILLGPDTADVPVRRCRGVGRARDCALSGGTGMGIRIARAHGIPVLNLGVLRPRAVCQRLEEIRIAAAAASTAMLAPRTSV